MAGKVVASYLVKVVLREPDALPVGAVLVESPTIKQLEGAVQRAVDDLAIDSAAEYAPEVRAYAERTDE